MWIIVRSWTAQTGIVRLPSASEPPLGAEQRFLLVLRSARQATPPISTPQGLRWRKQLYHQILETPIIILLQTIHVEKMTFSSQMLTTTNSSSLHRSNKSGEQRDTFSPRKRLELNPGHVCGCGRALPLPLSHLLSSTLNSTSTYASSKPQNHDSRSATDFQHRHVRFTRASLRCRSRQPSTIS